MKHILLVDDDVMNAEIFAQKLVKRGFRVTTRNSGADALEVIAADPVDAVLLDLVMPEEDGQSVLRRIRERYDRMSLPVLMVTATEGIERFVACLKDGADDYLAKPVHAEVAAAKITTYLRLGELHREHIMRAEQEVLKAMIITYNHEINQPLTVASAALAMLREGTLASEDAFNRLERAILRIGEIVQKIRALYDQPIAREKYLTSDMIRLTPKR